MANCNTIIIRNSKQNKVPSASNLAHNTTLKKATYWIKESNNLYQSFKPKNYNELNEIWNSWANEAKKRYKNKHKRNIRNDAVLIEEGMIIIGSDVDATDEQIHQIINNFIKKFEKDNNTKVRHFAYHNHEGFINKDKKPIINRHIHFLFDNVDNNGNMVRRNWKRSYLSQLQDDIYQVSKNIIPLVERATDYKKEGKKAPKQQHHRVFRKEKEQEQALKNAPVKTKIHIEKIEVDNPELLNRIEELKKDVYSDDFNIQKSEYNIFSNTTRKIRVKAKNKDVVEFLKKQVEELRAELKENKAKRSDYAQLEQLNRDLQAQIADNQLTEQQMRKTIQELKAELLKKPKIEVKEVEKVVKTIQQIEIENPINRELEELNQDLKEELEAQKALKADNDTLKSNLSSYKQDIATKQDELNKALEAQKALKADNDTLKSDLSSYKQDIAIKQDELNKALEAQKALKADNDTLKSDLSSYKQIETLPSTPPLEIKEIEIKEGLFKTSYIEIYTSDSVKKLKKAYNELKEKATYLLKENCTTRHKDEIENPINRELKQLNQDLKEELESTKQSLSTAQQQIVDYRANIELLNAQIFNLKADLKIQSKKSTDRQADRKKLNELEAQNKRLKEELEQIKSSDVIMYYAERSEQLERELKKLKESKTITKIETVENEININTQNQLIEAQEELKELKETLSTTKYNLECRERDIESLEANNSYDYDFQAPS